MDDDEITFTNILQFPAFCPWIATASVGSSEDNKERVIIGLTDRSKLYVNDRLISSESTSFCLRHDWLVFTTTSHTARFIPLDVTFDGKQLLFTYEHTYIYIYIWKMMIINDRSFIKLLFYRI